MLILTEPSTSSLVAGAETPIPTLPLNSARFTVPSELTSMLGIPDISLTAKIVPNSESLIENNVPDEPTNDRVGVLTSFILAVIVLPLEPMYAIFDLTFKVLALSNDKLKLAPGKLLSLYIICVSDPATGPADPV